jgi:ABC-2 type transport system permease protein
MLRFYIAVAETSFRRQLMYRYANLAGLLTNAFFGIIFSSVMIALFQSRPLVAGFDVRESLRYIWMVQSLVMTITTFGWYDVGNAIRSGEIVTDLSKPCDFFWYWCSRELGRSAYYLLFRGVPTYAVGMLLFGIGLPTDWRDWLGFFLVLPLSATMGFAYRFLYNLFAFWYVEARAFGTFAQVIALFMTGSYVPLPFFPGWLANIAAWLPFNGFINLPVLLILGKLSGGALFAAVARMLIWSVIMVTGVRWLAGRAYRKVVIQGG